MGPLVKFVGSSVLVGAFLMAWFVLSLSLLMSAARKIERNVDATCFDLGSR